MCPVWNNSLELSKNNIIRGCWRLTIEIAATVTELHMKLPSKEHYAVCLFDGSCSLIYRGKVYESVTFVSLRDMVDYQTEILQIN